MELNDKVDLQRINNTLGKMGYYLSTHDSICVGVSGGSDSNIIVHMIATYFREYLPKVHFCFVNTGLEYRATLKHLDFMEKYYNIKIDRIHGESVVSVIKREGVPILSKEFSKDVHYYIKGSKWALEKVDGDRSVNPRCFTDKQKKLTHYLKDNDVKVSSMCCDLSKKKPNKKYLKENNCDLNISGERHLEGGQRATAHKSCFEIGNKSKGKIDKYMPLWFWNDDTKQYYKEKEGIVYSDCYEVWGMKRTGCVGCPFNSRAGEDLKKIKQYEPQLYRACMNVFGKSYFLMDKFEVHRKPIFDSQITMFDEVNEND